MREARASPAVAHPRVVGDEDAAEVHDDSDHHYHISPPHQQHEQSWAGDSYSAGVKTPPSPADVGLEPPVRSCVSAGSTPARSQRPHTLADRDGHRYSGSGSDSGHDTHMLSGTADGGNEIRGTSTSVTTPTHLATHAQCGSSGAVEAAAVSQQQQRLHRHGTHSPHSSVDLASPSAANSHGQSSLGEATLYGKTSVCGTGGRHEAIPHSASRHEHLPVGAAQYTPVYVSASLTTITTSPAAARARASRSSQHARRKQQSNPMLKANSRAWHWGANPAVTAAFQQRQPQGRGRHVPAPLFSNVPTTAAMGAAVAARAQKSASNSSAAVSSPTTKAPQQRVTPTSISGGCLPVVAPTTELMRALTYAEETPKSEAATTATPPSACAAAVSPSSSPSAAAPSHSRGAPHHPAPPLSHTQAGGHRLDPAIGAAGQSHLVVTSQTEHEEDIRDGLRRVTSFSRGKESSLCSLVDSHPVSERTWPFSAFPTHEDPVKAAAAVDEASTSTEAHTTLDQHRFDDARRHMAPQLLGTGPATASGGTLSRLRTTGSNAVRSIPTNSGAASAQTLSVEHSAEAGGVLTIRSHCRRTDSEYSEHGSLITPGIHASNPAGQQQNMAAAGSPGIELANSTSMLKRSLTHPPLIAVTNSAAASGGLSGNSLAASPRLLTPQQHASDPSVLNFGASLGHRTTTVTNNSFWSSSSADANAVSNSTISGIRRAASAIAVSSRDLLTFASNSSIFLPGGSFAVAASAPTTRDPLTASVTQQSRSALIAELQQRRRRLQKQLALLQREATARNIFALVRASNASQLQYLLREGLCNVNDRDYNGCTPLHVAAGEGNQAIVHVLLSFGADVVAVDNNGRTPLDCAAANRHSGVARYLLTLIRNKHFSQGGGDGGFTSSGGDDGPPETMCCAKQTTGESPVVAGAYAGLTTSPVGHPSGRPPAVETAGSVLALDASPGGLLTDCTATSTQRNTSAQRHSTSSGSSLIQSPAPPQPLSWQNQQQRHPASSPLVASTPSPSRPPNWKRPPVNLAASSTTMDAESWSDSDVPPHAVVWGAKAAAAAGTAANNSLTGYESPASMPTPLCWYGSSPHGSSPQRRVVLSSLDSAAAAHSRGLIAAEANAGATSTKPSSAYSNSNSTQLATSAATDISPAAGAAAGSGGDGLKRHMMSAPLHLLDRGEENASEGKRQTATQRPPSLTYTTTALITAAAGSMAGWHDGDEPLADTDVEGIEDALLGRRGHLSMRRRRMLIESGNSPHGGFASMSSDSWSGSSRTLAARQDPPHNRRDCSSFETGSFPGEVPVPFSSPSARMAVSGAAAPAASTRPTLGATSSGSAQQRQMLLRPPRRPDSFPAATDQRGTTMAAEADRYPVRVLGSDHGSAARLTPMAPSAATTSVTIPVYSLMDSGPKCEEELTSSTVASCAESLRGGGARSSSICDMGQQSLEEHQHHYRMTVFGMRGSQRQSKGGSGFDRDPTPPPLLQPTRVTLESARMEAAVTEPSPLSSEVRGITAAAPVLTTLASTTAIPAATTAPKLATPVTTLHHSSYTTISDTVSIVVCMVGLPGRGKSFISKRLMRYMNWKGVPCRVFNAGNYRRQLLGVEGTAGADFFDPNNSKGAQLRERMAELACEDLVSFVASHALAVGILDATNTTRKRRAWLSDYFQQEAQRHAVPYRLLFIESVCNDDTIVTENILRSKCGNDDFKNLQDVSAVISEFRSRIVQYEKVYETLEAEERMPYIKIVDVKHHVILHRVPNGLGSRIAFFLLNLHPIAFPIYVALPGETVGDSKHVYGGEERLTARGEAYAIALKRFIQDRYVPHMVVLHATNYCVLSTLAPLMEGAEGEEGVLTPKVPGVASDPGASVGDSSGTSKTATPASQHPHGVGGSPRCFPRGASAQRQSSARTLVSASASHKPASHHCGSDKDSTTSESSSRHSLLPSRDGQLRELHAYAPSTIAEELRAMEDGDLSVAPPQCSTLPGATDAMAREQFMQEDDSDQVDEDEEGEIGDEVLCPVPGLDNINFGRFSGHTAAWVKDKYPRLSALLYDMNDGDVMGDARVGAEAPPQRQEHWYRLRESSSPTDATALLAPAGSAKATGGDSHHHSDQRSGAFPAAEWLSAPLPPPVHYATHEEAVSHLQRASSGADPRLSYCTQLPNGESYRQVNVRLEPALMAVMRTQSPVFVVAPAVPAQGLLSFFMDVIPELSPTIRIPRGCVIEIGVKDSITVHPLLPDSLPESMTRSPLTVLPEIREAIREVAAASFMERSRARTFASVSDSALPGDCTGEGVDGAALPSTVAAVSGAVNENGDVYPVSASTSQVATAPSPSS